MANFLLVHGSNHGAWCWRHVVEALQALGHTAEAIDLPSHGEDTTPIEEVTLDLYARAILDRLDRPTVLVAHSAAGFAITQAAEIDPTNVAAEVFVCAYVPQPGKSLVDMLKEAPAQPLKGALEMGHGNTAFRFKEHALPELLYHDCPPETAAHAIPLLGWQPMAPQLTPATFTGAGAHVPRDYILCRNDRTIPPEHQRMMAADFPPEHVHEIDTGHSPFFADPRGLAALLDGIAPGT